MNSFSVVWCRLASFSRPNFLMISLTAPRISMFWPESQILEALSTIVTSASTSDKKNATFGPVIRHPTREFEARHCDWNRDQLTKSTLNVSSKMRERFILARGMSHTESRRDCGSSFNPEPVELTKSSAFVKPLSTTSLAYHFTWPHVLTHMLCDITSQITLSMEISAIWEEMASRSRQCREVRLFIPSPICWKCKGSDIIKKPFP